MCNKCPKSNAAQWVGIVLLCAAIAYAVFTPARAATPASVDWVVAP